MVDRIPSGTTIPQMFTNALADGHLSFPEAQAIYSRIISDGVRPEEVSAVRGIVDALRTGVSSNPATGNILTSALSQATAERSNTNDMARTVLEHIESWSRALTAPMPTLGPDTDYHAYFAGVISEVASRYPNTPHGVRNMMSDVAHIVADRFPLGAAGRADALAGAYSAICDRYFEHNGAALDFRLVHGHHGPSTSPNPEWADLFRVDGLAPSDHGRADGVSDTDCKGYALLGEFFFREAGVAASSFHYADVQGADGARAPLHAIAYAVVEGHTIAMSNGDAEVVANHTPATLAAFAARQTNRPYTAVISEHVGGHTWLPLTEPPVRHGAS